MVRGFRKSTGYCRDTFLVVVDPKISFYGPLSLTSYTLIQVLVTSCMPAFTFHVHVHACRYGVYKELQFCSMFRTWVCSKVQAGFNI